MIWRANRAGAGMHAAIYQTARAVVLAIGSIVTFADVSAAGALFECKSAAASDWRDGKFTQLNAEFDAFWHVSDEKFYVDTDAKKLRFPDLISYDFEISQDGGAGTGGNDWLMVGQLGSNSRDLYLRIRPFTSSEGGAYPSTIPFGQDMPFLLIHPSHIMPVTGTCKGLARSD